MLTVTNRARDCKSVHYCVAYDSTKANLVSFPNTMQNVDLIFNKALDLKARIVLNGNSTNEPLIKQRNDVVYLRFIHKPRIFIETQATFIVMCEYRMWSCEILSRLQFNNSRENDSFKCCARFLIIAAFFTSAQLRLTHYFLWNVRLIHSLGSLFPCCAFVWFVNIDFFD